MHARYYENAMENEYLQKNLQVDLNKKCYWQYKIHG